ncbi:hypothetical protein AAHB60_04515 [Pseudomonas aeruginosa]
MPFVFQPTPFIPSRHDTNTTSRRCAMSDTLLHPSRFTHHHRVLHAVLLDEEG